MAPNLIVEDGRGLADALSYGSLVEAYAYHAAQRTAAWLSSTVEDDDRVAALVRGTRYLDGAYRGRFPGYRLRGRDQALEWPRTNATIPGMYGMQFYTLPQNEVPREVKQALFEAAARELVKPGSLSPDIKQGGSITNLQAGPVSVTFSGGGLTGQNIFQQIEMLISPVLEPVQVAGGRLGRC